VDFSRHSPARRTTAREHRPERRDPVRRDVRRQTGARTHVWLQHSAARPGRRRSDGNLGDKQGSGHTFGSYIRPDTPPRRRSGGNLGDKQGSGHTFGSNIRPDTPPGRRSGGNLGDKQAPRAVAISMIGPVGVLWVRNVPPERRRQGIWRQFPIPGRRRGDQMRSGRRPHGGRGHFATPCITVHFMYLCDNKVLSNP